MPGNRACASSAAYWAETSVSRDCPLQVIESKRKPGGQGRCRRPAPPSLTVYRQRTFHVKSVSVSPGKAACRPWRCTRSSGGAGPWECRASQVAGTGCPAGQDQPGRPRADPRSICFFSGNSWDCHDRVDASRRGVATFRPGRREPRRREPGGRFFSLFRPSYCCASSPNLSIFSCTDLHA